mgnify:CR=1 FL=1
MPGIPEKKTFVGKVTSLALTGEGQNSAQLLFTVEQGAGSNAVKHAFVYLDYPRHERQVFAGAVSMLTAAYFAKTAIEVAYVVDHPTDVATGIFIPPSKARPKKK